MSNRRIANRILSLLLVLLLAATSSFAYAASSRGDVNGDGVLDAADALAILRYIVQIEKLTDEQKRRADVDGNGDITANDASRILRYIVKLDRGFEACDIQVTLLVTSDMHGEVWSRNVMTNQPQGSALQSSAYIDFVRTSLKNVMVLDGGNSLFGSRFSDPDGSDIQPMTELFELVGYDAVLLGNEDFSNGLLTLRKQIDSLQSKGVAVLAGNFLKNDATTADAKYAPWNGCVPFIIKTYYNEHGDAVRVGVIGLSDTSIDYSDEFFGVGGVEPRSMLEMYRYYEPILAEQCDITVVLAHCNIEADAYVGSDYEQSVRALVENTNTIDLVISGHTSTDSPRFVQNSSGTDIAIMGTGAGPQTLCHAQLKYNALDGRLECALGCINASDREDLTLLYDNFKPVADKYESISEQVVGILSEPVDPVFDELIPTGWMTLLHRSHIWAVEQWRDENAADLPMEILSLSYPYIDGGEGLPVGHVTAGMLFNHMKDNPTMSLVIVQGSEIRAFLDAYAGRIRSEKDVYSIYGINYRLDPNAIESERVV